MPRLNSEKGRAGHHQLTSAEFEIMIDYFNVAQDGGTIEIASLSRASRNF